MNQLKLNREKLSSQDTYNQTEDEANDSDTTGTEKSNTYRRKYKDQPLMLKAS